MADVFKADPKDVKVLGPFAGGPVVEGHIGEATTVSEDYVGVGPLLVPCTRGEQKALSGDVIVQVFMDKPDPEPDYEFIFLLPKEVADAIIDATSPIDGMSVENYNKFQEKRAARKEAKTAVLSAHLTPNKPTDRSGHLGGPAATHPVAPTPTRPSVSTK